MSRKEIVAIDPFMIMDAKDEQQILASIEGQIVTELVYKVDGKTALSLQGVNHMCFKMGHVKIDPTSYRVDYDEKEDEYTGYVIAINEKYNLSALGTATQPRLMDVHVKDEKEKWVKNDDGSWKMAQQKDRFAKTKAMSKAERNAKRKVIPEPVLKKYLEYFLALKEGKKVNPPTFEVDYTVITTQGQRKQDNSTKSPNSKGIPVFKNANGKVVATVSVASLMKYLEAGVESGKFKTIDFDIDDLNGAYIIKNTRYIDYWDEVNKSVREIGGEWIRFEDDKSKNHWWIPIQGSDAKPPTPPKQESKQSVSSIEELEEIINRRIVGADKKLAVTQDSKGFDIEPLQQLDPEIVELISFIAEGLGGGFREVPGGYGFIWEIPLRAQ